MPKAKGRGRRKKSKTHQIDAEEEKRIADAPKSLIFARGTVGKSVQALCLEWRHAMMPFTASKLKVGYKDKVRHFADMAKAFGCNNIHVFSCPSSSAMLKLVRPPQGPTLTFRVDSYKLRKDVANDSRKDLRIVSDQASYSKPPLCVLNGFNSSERHLQLVVSTFQGMFPTIHVDQFRLTDCKRVLLVNYNKQLDVIDIRHYGIIARRGGLSSAAKKLTRGQMPKRLGDIAAVEELFGARAANYLSDTDGEGENVELPQNFKNIQSGTQTRLKLQEIGPRLTVTLMKVESGFWGGETVYHKLFQKTPEEVAETEQRFKLRERLRQMRKKEQDANVERKRKAAEELKAAKAARKSADAADPGAGSEDDAAAPSPAPAPKRRRVAMAEDEDSGDAPAFPAAYSTRPAAAAAPRSPAAAAAGSSPAAAAAGSSPGAGSARPPRRKLRRKLKK
eukprot:TRINITY_DN70204_c0_g1_i1.p1 TRINITY_DN70204_c0_g1~~TRINITY_DN70204_c0_g1_i1.p1  ORF type:complete len:480 (+),score=205.61 TRINITY_DN70204_c0_g1_i1:95-1441(+)